VRLSSSLRHVAAAVALALLLPTCLLADPLSELTGASAGDGGGGETGGAGESGAVGDAPPGPDVQDAPRDVADDGNSGSSDGGEGGVLSYAATVLSDGPIAYWRLDDTTTATAKDISGNGHDGSYQGGVTLGVRGAIANDLDSAVQFDGSGEMVAAVPNSFDFTGNVPYTVEVWAKPMSTPTGMAVVGTNTYAADAGGYMGWYVAYNNNAYLDNWRNNGGTGNPAPAPGAFIHIVGTYDGATLAMYVNGQSFSSNPSATVLPATGAPFTAGRVADWTRFTGVLDEIAIYDKVLSATRIAAHYARGTGQ
jgi:hypothetical protein